MNRIESISVVKKKGQHYPERVCDGNSSDRVKTESCH